MYSYLINSNKKIKAEILNKEDFIVLGTPEDIISFDENYLEKNIERGNMEIWKEVNELKKFYK